MSEMWERGEHPAQAEVHEPVQIEDKIAYRCPECHRSWKVSDDPNEWAYGHDCEEG